jgi:hypothetical protein
MPIGEVGSIPLGDIAGAEVSASLTATEQQLSEIWAMLLVDNGEKLRTACINAGWKALERVVLEEFR